MKVPAQVTANDLATWLSFAVSLASIVLGAAAIWLSVQFYRWSQTSQKAVEDASGELGKAVNRLEVMVEKLADESFDLIKTSYRDMSQHVWTSAGSTSDVDIQSRVDATVSERIAPLEEQFTQALRETRLDKAEIERIEALARELVQTTASETLEAEVDATFNLRDTTLNLIRRRRTPIPLGVLSRRLNDLSGVEMGDVVDVLFDLAREGLVTWDGNPSMLAYESRIRAVRPEHRLNATRLAHDSGAASEPSDEQSDD